jgi:hypothetical protein
VKTDPQRACSAVDAADAVLYFRLAFRLGFRLGFRL